MTDLHIPRLAASPPPQPGELPAPVPPSPWMAAADMAGDDSDATKLKAEQARHEVIKRAEREFRLAVKRGEYVARAANQQAAAVFLAICAQHFRSLADNLERQVALSPEACEIVDRTVDTALADLAKALQSMSTPTNG